MIHEDVRRLLLAEIEEYEQLEVLLLLHRAHRPLTMEEIAQEARMGRERVEGALRHLHGRGLVRSTQGGRHVFAPERPELAAVVDGLARAYDEDRVGIIQLMSAHALERLRDVAIRTFAEAFRVRGPKKNG